MNVPFKKIHSDCNWCKLPSEYWRILKKGFNFKGFNFKGFNQLTLILQDLSQYLTYKRQLMNVHWRIKDVADLHVNNCKTSSENKLIVTFCQWDDRGDVICFWYIDINRFEALLLVWVFSLFVCSVKWNKTHFQQSNLV